ncbi:hypothetical protein B296_00013878 [Ensete ventricosum]|uniref:Uncharacterized protein n=1 Tax=Ensete ventricosum TaxID=4639 RepID=A0A426Y790_ENSVE|nr:hypothetical protein B296_00013878 [Ensete ventricosum]
MGSSRKFARRFAEGIGKLTGNAKGDYREEDRRTYRKITGGCRSLREGIDWNAVVAQKRFGWRTSDGARDGTICEVGWGRRLKWGMRGMMDRVGFLEYKDIQSP